MVYNIQVIKHAFKLFLVANFLVINASSQTNINCKILDEETNEELIGASVKIVNSNYGCVTRWQRNSLEHSSIIPISIQHVALYPW